MSLAGCGGTLEPRTRGRVVIRAPSLNRTVTSGIRRLAHPRHLGEFVLIAFAFLFYYLVRGLVVERVDEAFDRAERLIEMEKQLGLFIEPGAQALILGKPILVEAANSMYLYGHGPVILVFALLLYVSSRPNYLLMRNAFLISGGIGLFFYYLTPMAPPRFMPEYGFVDTVFQSYGVERVLMPDLLKNQYAAMPSLHFGWNMLLGVGIWMAFSPNLAARAVAVLMPLAMLMAIVVTANHFVLDAVVGTVVVLAGLGLALLARRAVARLHLKQQASGSGKLRPLVAFACWLGGLDHGRESPRRGTPAYA